MKRQNLNRVAGLAMGLALAASAGTAHATAFTAQQLLSSFNLITSGSVSTQSDIEGSTVVGGNLNGATFFNNSSDAGSNPAIYLYGTNTNGNSTNINSGGNLYYSGTSSGHVNFNGNPAGKQITTLPNPLSDYTTPLTQLSTKLGTLAATGGTSVTNGNFNAGSATGIVVFNLTANQLNNDINNSQITFSGSGVTSYIVNVTGSFSEGSSTNFNTKQSNAIFNFVDATSVTLGNWQTSVLAPKAALNISNGFIDGSVFAASFGGGGELHNDDPFTGALPASAPVPEVSTWAMMLAGFAFVGFAMRARREPALALCLARI